MIKKLLPLLLLILIGCSEPEPFSVPINDGNIITYHETGQIIEEKNFNEKGELHGIYKSYFEDGFVEHQGMMKNGKKDGEWIVYYDEPYNSSENRKLFVRNFKDGKLFGMWTSYHWKGYKKSEGLWEDNLRVGEHIEYYENGNIKKKGTFMNGFDIGEHIEYYENGNIKEVQQFPNELTLHQKFLVFIF